MKIAILLSITTVLHNTPQAQAQASAHEAKANKTGKNGKTVKECFDNEGLRTTVNAYFDQKCLYFTNCDIIRKYGAIGDWCTSEVTDMNNLFLDRADFNQPLAKWDVGKVTAMNGMFSGATTFNQPLDEWKVGQVTNMYGMFYQAASFNKPLATWDVGNVIAMFGMFAGAVAFNQPLAVWNVGSVQSMEHMFFNADKFNQPLGVWTMNTVENTVAMFQFAADFNQDLCAWGGAPQLGAPQLNQFAQSGCTYPDSIGCESECGGLF